MDLSQINKIVMINFDILSLSEDSHPQNTFMHARIFLFYLKCVLFFKMIEDY